jgi:eukaryotic-like serine/threonine-protein kinase
MPLNTGQVLNNRYRIVKLLGQGGFGAVYRAWDNNLKGPCALKENLDTSTNAQDQFAREASLLYNLRHANLPRVTDHFVVAGQGQYLVMDYVEGDDLQSMLDRTPGGLPEDKVLVWMGQICDALGYMHSQNPPVIHRDIKPANIKITPQEQAILVDFGIAKTYDPNLKTIAGARAVTPGFSPPEQYGAGKTDARSDVYALGATMYALLNGQPPPQSVDLLRQAESLPVLPNRLSPHIRAAVERAMQFNPDMRFQTTAEFKAALQSSSKPTPTGQAPVDKTTLVTPLSPAQVVAPVVRPADFGTSYVPAPSAAASPKKSNTAMTIAVIVVVVLCICAVVGYLGWNYGDSLLRMLGLL